MCKWKSRGTQPLVNVKRLFFFGGGIISICVEYKHNRKFLQCFTIIDLNNEIVNDVLVGKLHIIVGILVITQAHKYATFSNC
jgi:hypothetical protein